MTIPWKDQSSLSNQCLHPTNLEPDPKDQESESVPEKGRPEYSDIHPSGKVDPSESSEIYLPPLRNTESSLCFDRSCFVEPLHEYKCLVIEKLVTSFETLLLSQIFSLSIPSYPEDSRSTLPEVFCDDPCWNNFVLGHSPYRIRSLTGRGLARFTFRLSLVFFLLLIVDTENSLNSSNELQNNQTIKLFSASANFHDPAYFIQSVLLKGYKSEVWANPKQKFKTVGKHRCYCMRNSFFVSHHDPSKSDLDYSECFGSIPLDQNKY